MTSTRFLFLTLLTVLVSPLQAAPAEEWHFVPPKDSGVANVKDFGAKGDGVTDDTAAISAAISANIDKRPLSLESDDLVSDGTYLVTGPVEGRLNVPGVAEGKNFSAGWRSMLVLIGETRSGAVIKLKDNAPGYTDAAKPKWIVATGSEGDKKDNFEGGGNRAFRHSILNLTVDAGSGNPGAIGIDLIANNRGSNRWRNDPRGGGERGDGDQSHAPLAGPAMVMDVRIEGFARGLKLDHYQYGMTFENIQMSGQREVGIVVKNNVLTMRRVQFEGTVPFYTASGGNAMLCLLDSTITGKGTDAAAAMTSPGMLNLRRVTVTGFGKAVDDTSKANADVAAGVIKSHDQGFQLNAAGGNAVPLDLPIEEIPTVRPPAGAVWTDGGNTRASLQGAIDAGAEWIYLKPVQTVNLDDTLILRGKVKLILGLTGCIKGPPGKAAIRVDEGQTPMVVLEQIYVDGIIEHPSSRTLCCGTAMWAGSTAATAWAESMG